RLQMAGPALGLVFFNCGLFLFFFLRGFGEVGVHPPFNWTFFSFWRVVFGEEGAFVFWWACVINWAMEGVCCFTLRALFMCYWGG
ncbi:amino acid permease, partial [Escherichia coli]|nr:amino acid permease [Escherichia coli]